MPSDTPGDATPRDPGMAGEGNGIGPTGDPARGDRAGEASSGDAAADDASTGGPAPWSPSTGGTPAGGPASGTTTGGTAPGGPSTGGPGTGGPTTGGASTRDPVSDGTTAGEGPSGDAAAGGDTTTGGPTTAPAIAKPGWRESRAEAGDDKPKETGRRAAARFLRGKDHRDRVRVRRVLRVVRHIDPWSVLRVSGLFFAALFVIICVASAALWTVARSSGAVDDVEGFVTSVGGFGNCENLDPSHPSATTTTAPGATTTTVAGADPATETTVGPVEPVDPVNPVDDEDCPAGQELVGEFRFEDGRILQAYILGGVVLVVAGAAGMVVLTLLFNVFSDITGGVRVTVLEEDRKDAPAGSPPKRDRG